ncbi:MAG: M23 family metallopeptidase [Hamadaea sp.]|nr:M23 family metallopeptidase [Hamadaea sp.]
MSTVRTSKLARGAIALAIVAAGVLAIQSPAAAAPSFQLPFPCGQTWTGDSNDSSAHVSWEIDFNRGSTATADENDTVLASAAGTVEVAANQGDVNGYGNLIVINHGGGYYSYYAHLERMAVVAGQAVLRGQVIGGVGDTTKSTNDVYPHLHYEVRYPDRSQSHIIKSVFNGVTFPYTHGSVTSNNCATPYDPREVCGSGFNNIDSVKLGSAGTVNLLWNGSTSQNCAVTLKFTSVGTATATTVFLEPQGSTRTTDSGNYGYYSGPVIRTAPTCVRWGGSTGGYSYTSAFEHC